MEVGSISQNIYLQAVSLNLGTVLIGAFYDGEVQKVMGLGGMKFHLVLCRLDILKPNSSFAEFHEFANRKGFTTTIPQGGDSLISYLCRHIDL